MHAARRGAAGKYILFDMPGQVELYTHHKSVQRLVRTLEQWGFRVRCNVAAEEASERMAYASAADVPRPAHSSRRSTSWMRTTAATHPDSSRC